MSGFDANRVYTVSVLPPDPHVAQDSPAATQQQLQEFIMKFRLGEEFIYRFVLFMTVDKFILISGIRHIEIDYGRTCYYATT